MLPPRSSGVADETQIHTHMCYSEFNDIINAIGALDADVISIETARSRMELLEAFTSYRYPNEIGPGVYDIHAPRCPSVDEMVALLDKARQRLAVDRIWVNPDCGLKTRQWGRCGQLSPTWLKQQSGSGRGLIRAGLVPPNVQRADAVCRTPLGVLPDLEFAGFA